MVGGRGQKAPYKTTIVRVPNPLIPLVEKMMTTYREKVIKEKLEDDSALRYTQMETFVDAGMDEHLINECKEILEKRGSRKAALSKLLQVVLQRPVSVSELE